MKRFAALCAALLGIALFLTACGKPQESDAPAEPAQTARDQSARATLPFAVGRLYDLPWSDYYYAVSGCSDGKAFYMLEPIFLTDDTAGAQQRSMLIMRIDFETRVQAPLCSLPDCTHGDTNCPAFLCGITGRDRFQLTVVEGQLYVLHLFQEQTPAESGSTAQPPTVWLDRAATDGSGRQRVAELPAGWGLDEGFPITDGAAMYGQYVDLNDSSAHGVRVALDTGEITSFSFGLDDREELLGALEGQFVLRRSDDEILQSAYPTVMTPERVAGIFPDDAHFSNTRRLLLYDPNAGMRTDVTDIFRQIELSYAPFYSFIQQGYFYHLSGDQFTLPQILWQIDPAGGTGRVLTEFEPPSVGSWHSLQTLRLFPAGPDVSEPYILVSYWDNYNVYSLVDVRDGSVREIGLRHTISPGEMTGSRPYAQTEDGLWLVPVEYVPMPFAEFRVLFGLAEPETVFSGVGDVYPIQMWASPDALG